MAKLSQLLLFDPDPRGLAETTASLQKEGCDVVTSGNVPLATALLKTSGAPLVLVALREPERVGLQFIQTATTAPESKNLACVATGPAKFREPALQAGAVCFISSPNLPRDLLDACRLVAAAMVPGTPPSADAEAALKLADLGGVYYLVRAMAPTGRSCAVEILHRQRRADLRFIDGNLSSVQVGSLAGLAALHRCLLWDDADVRLKFRNVVRRGGQLSMKDEEVIEECDRFQRDFAHEVRELGIARTVFRAGDQGVTPTPANEMIPLLRLFDGHRDLGQVLDESPFRVFDTLTITKQFAATGAIVRASPLPLTRQAEPPVSGPAALEPWFQRPPSLPPAAAGIPTAMKTPAVATAIPTRPSSPFVKVVSPVATSERKPSESAVPRARTITQREQPAPRTPSGGLRTRAREKATTSSSAGVARGEIQVRPHLTKKGERSGDRSPPFAAPSVLVDIESLPPARPMSPSAPAPLTAHRRVAATPPSVIVSPLTPPPVPTLLESIKTPPAPRAEPAASRTPPAVRAQQASSKTPPAARLEHASSKTPPAARAEHASSKTPPAVRVEPVLGKTPPAARAEHASSKMPPAARAEDPSTRTPAARAEHAPGKTPPATRAEAVHAEGGRADAPRKKNPAASSFNAVEADFFEREADLYKGEAAETFDDLDGAGAPPRPRTTRKR